MRFLYDQLESIKPDAKIPDMCVLEKREKGGYRYIQCCRTGFYSRLDPILARVQNATDVGVPLQIKKEHLNTKINKSGAGLIYGSRKKATSWLFF